MRILLALVLMLAPLTRLSACSCAGPGTPCTAAGSSAAVFTGKVLEITGLSRPLPVGNIGPALASRRSGDYSRSGASMSPSPRPLRVVRIQLGEVLSGVDREQKEIEIVTGQGGDDCGYAFQIGVDYVVYAYKNAEGRLETGSCSRTRTLPEATEDIEYFRAMSNAPETGDLRVLTGLADTPGKPGVTIIAEREGSRYRALTNAAGDAVFTGLSPGDYTIHAESDGDLSDDPKVQLHAKGCLDLTLFRTLRITGRVMTRSGLPAARVEVQLRSTQEIPADGAMTDSDGHYDLRIVRAGQYHLGINLNHTPTRDTPYARWFYPGTEDPVLATSIDFSGRPEVRTYDFTLPDRQPERAIEGIVLRTDGQPMPRAVVTVFDSSKAIVTQAFAGQNGRFALHVFVGTSYRLLAVWPGNTEEAVSALPLDIQPDSSPLSLRLTLTQPGNLFLEEYR
jgi:hypothetical protein